MFMHNFLRLLNDMASSIAYEAAVAGFTYSAESTHSGISLKFAGFSQKLPNLIDYYTSLMATGTIQADKFNQIKNQYAFDLANVAYTDAWSQTMLDLGLLLVPEGWAYTDMLNALQTTTLANLESYKKCLFASFRAESLVLVISCRELLQT
jgi:insulysin